MRSILALALFLTTPALAADADWTWSPDGKVQWAMPADGGVVLTATPKAVHALDVTTGDVLWSRDDMKKVIDSGVTLLDGTPGDLIAAADGGLGNVPGMGKLRMVNRFTGADIWSTDAQWLVLWSKVLPADDTLYWMGSSVDDKGRGYLALVKAKLTTGEIVWMQDNRDKDALFAKKLAQPEQYKARPDKKLSMRMTVRGQQEPVVLPDGDLLDAWVSNGVLELVRRDARTGAAKWRVTPKGLGPVTQTRGFAQMAVHDGVLYVPAGTAQLWAFDVKDGSEVWNNAKTPKQKGAISFLQIEGDKIAVGGLAATGKGFVNVLNREDGSAAWKKPALTMGMTNTLVRDGKVWFSDAKDRFTALNLADGATVTEQKIALEFGEDPGALRWRDDHFVITSDQNVVGVEPDGSVRFHASHKAPGPGGFAIAAGVISVAMQAASEAAAQSDRNNFDYSSAKMNEQMADMWGDTANELLSRKKASTGGDHNHFVMTRVDEGSEKGPGVVRVNLDSGDATGQVVLDMREPDYEIDEENGWVIVNDSGKSLMGFSFGPEPAVAVE